MRLDSDIEAVLGGLVAPAVEAPAEPVVTAVTEQTSSPIQAQWERFKPQFAAALEGSIYDLADLERKIGQGRAYLFPGVGAAVVGEKVAYPGETVFQTLWAVGDVEEILALTPGIEAFARLIGCASMLVEGRRGWERSLKHLGYDFWSITLRKGL